MALLEDWHFILRSDLKALDNIEHYFHGDYTPPDSL